MRPIFLWGFMGTGKSTVGPRVAAMLDRPFVDTDALIERDAGRSIAELWRSEGEQAFRERERRLVQRYLDDAAPNVVALGGGALLPRDLRHAALDRGTVVTLTAAPGEIHRRVGDARPLLAGNALARITELLELRAEAYAECHARLSTDGVAVDDVVEAVCAVSRRDALVLPLGERTYRIDVVIDAPDRLTDAIVGVGPSSLVVVSDATVHRLRGEALRRSLSSLAIPFVDVTLAAGEEQKTLASVQAIWDAALGAGVDRDVLVLAFGGGVVSDLAGFAAATLLRGVACLYAPTTLLAMADASVGGKTGFDHPAGKNLVGAIHQPRAVVADLAHLQTLSLRELRAGFAEIVKVALIGDPDLFALLESKAAAFAAGGVVSPELASVLRAAVAIKARIVRDDEHELGQRALLNLGHTVGHALEAHGGYRKYLHGEAVAMGLCVEVDLAVKRGLTPPDVAARTRALLRSLGLPTDVAGDEWRGAKRFVRSDKKRREGRLRLPFVQALGKAEVRDTPPDFFET